MAVTNLTNTTWEFASDIALSSLTNNTDFNVTLENSNGIAYTGFNRSVVVQPQPPKAVISTTRVSDSAIITLVWEYAQTGAGDTWNSEFSDRIIKFTGGTDATNSTLINWIEANAIQQTSELDFELINHLNVGGIEYEINDARVSSGTAAPSTAVPNPKEGDIYFQSVGDIRTSDGWSYVIGPGGLCRMWKPVNLGTVTPDHWWGNVGCVDAIMPTQTYPVTFKEPPCVFWMGSCDSYDFWIFNCYSGQLATVDHPHQISLGRYNNLNSPLNVCIWLFVIGQV